MSPNIQELAISLGVHKATVSRALRGKPGVSEPVRRRILDAAALGGFYPNGQARALSTDRTEVIVLAFCDATSAFLSNPFYSMVLEGIAHETADRGFSLAFCSLSNGSRKFGDDALPKVILERRADGVLFVGDVDERTVLRTRELGHPVVLADHSIRGAAIDTVVADNRGGARAAVEYLLSLGHRRIGFVGGSLRSQSFDERLQGFREALGANGCPCPESFIQVGEHDEGRRNMSRLLLARQRPTAIFACNDATALHALNAVYEKGLGVPNDLSLIGFDDSRCAVEAWPHLSTMRIDAKQLGRAAVRTLFGRLENEDAPPVATTLPAALVIRSTTAQPKDFLR
jgi:LacI family transcriptional regulator